MRASVLVVWVTVGLFAVTSASADDLQEALRLARFAGELFDKHEYQQAIEPLNAALERTPRRAEVWACRGICHLQLGKWDSAIDDFGRAIELRPADASLYNLRATCWMNKGEIARAISDASIAVEKNPKDAEHFTLRARLWERTGDFRKAIADASSAIELEPKDTKLFFLRAMCWKHLGEMQKAVDDCSAAIRLNPQDPRVFVYKGLAELERGEHAKARSDFESALTLSPRDARANEMLVLTLAASPLEDVRDGIRAIKHGKEFLSQSPNPRPGMRLAMAAALAETGQFEEAIHYLKKTPTDNVDGIGELDSALVTMFQSKQPFRLPLHFK